jgi:hypothetical protein
MSAHAPACDVFISYSREDEKAALLLCAELDKSKTTYYLDQRSGKVGDEWLYQIKLAIDRARYFALIYSENVNKSTYVKQEVECAAGVSRRGWILLDDSQPRQEIRKLLGRINASVAYKGDRDCAIQEFAVSIAKALWKPAVLRRGPAKLSHEKSPYRPYRSYEKSDTLFGRDSEIKEITASIYEALDAVVDPEIGKKKRLIFVYGPSGTGKSSLMASGVIPRLAYEGKVHIEGPLQLRAMERNFEGYAAEANGKPCVIAIDQFEEIWPEYGQDLPPDTKKLVDNITTALNHFDKSLAIVLSFREEYLAKVEGHFRPLEDYWCRHAVRPLSGGDADDCIRGPAAELDIFYEDRLAAALVKALSKTADSRGPNGEEIIYVEPVELQIVCERLWKAVDEEIQDIHSADLLKACDELKLETKGRRVDDVEQLARIFFEHVTQGFLDGAVAEISNAEVAIAAKYNNTERIYFALRQFVSDTRKRISLKTHTEGGQNWVGRLPMSIVHEMTRRYLLRKAVDIPGEERYELVHDRLAEKIIEKKEQMDLYYAANSLGSEMTKVMQKRAGGLQGWFEDYESTIKDVTEFKKFQGLNPGEAEFVLRSALAYGKDKQKELEEWAWTVAEQHPLTLAGVLHDAFSAKQQNGRARMNAAILLRQRWLQVKLLRAGEFMAILAKIQTACRRASERAKEHPNVDSELAHLQAEYEQKFEEEKTKSNKYSMLAKLQADYDRDVEYAKKNPKADSELEELCYTLAACPIHSGCEHFDQVLPKKGNLAEVDPRILLWMRDKANMDGGGCFALRWKCLPAGRRASLTLQLYWLRFRIAFLRMAFIVFISTMTTAVGAALMFALWGSFGASFTQASSVSGLGQGLFHGVFGGIIWGSFTSGATLIYWLILRGRRIEKKFSHWLGGVALSALSGLLGGIVLSIMVLNVDAVSTMKAAGWLKLNTPSVYRDAFHETGGGWILPIYGLFLGIGVGWSMLSLYHDRDFRTFVAEQKPLKSGKQLFKWLRAMVWRTLLKSAPTAAGMALAAVSLCFLFRGHTLDCRPYQWNLPGRCDVRDMYPPPEPKEKLDGQSIAPLEWRAAGMAAIIFAGAYSMTVGYLLSLLTIRFGVEVPEDERFLVANDQKAASAPVGAVDAGEAS